MTPTSSPPRPAHLPIGAVIYPAAFAMALTLMQASLGIIFFARDVHHAQPGQIGWLAGTWAITYTLGCLWLRPLFKHLEPRQQVVISTVCLCAILIGMQVVPTLAGLFVFHGLFGLLLALYWPSLMGWLSTGSEGERLGRLVSRFNLSWSFGNIIGPYVCGWLLHLNVRLPLAVGAATSLVIAGFVAAAGRRLPSSAEEASAHAAAGNAPPRVDQSTLLRYPAWLGHFAAYFTVGAVAGIFPVGARDQLGCSETLIGFIFLVRGLANTVAFLGMGRTPFWHFRLWPMLVGQTVAIAAFALLTHATSLIAVTLLLSLANFAAGISYSESIFHGASGSMDRTHRMAIHEALIGIGLFIGSAVGGMVYEATSLQGLFALCAGALALATLGQALLHRMLRPR
ncbi:MAG: MFS transporter [Lentisphaerae bacterium]|nr:MFS transporter [Lentisphaerota bacterium]